MSKTPNYDAKVKAILDAAKPGDKICALTGEKWNMTAEELGWYKHFNVPPSKYHPHTRMWLMTAFWTSFQWWWQRHPETGKPILTYIHPATGLKVLPDREWEQKEFLSVGKPVDLSRSILDQLREQQLRVPLSTDNHAKIPEKSIAIFFQGDVESYFVAFCRSKNSLYGIWGFDVEDSSEIWDASSIQKSYAVGHAHRIYQCESVRESFDCMNSSFLFDCRNCEFCFGATNKRNRKYLWFNEQLTEAEWKRRRAEVDFRCRSTYEMYKKKFEKLLEEQAVWPENFNEQTENSSGEYLNRVTNMKFSYLSMDGPHDCYWTGGAVGDAHDNAFCCGTFNASECYYTANADRSLHIFYSHNCATSQNLEYSMQCRNCEDCFGCAGLNHKRFCIFNVQYTEVEYWQKLDEIKCAMLDRGEYGEFLPTKMAPVYFSDSGAIVYYGADSAVGKKFGALDFDPESAGAIGEDLSDASKLRQVSEVPDCIDQVGDEWAGVPLYDPNKKRRFAYLRPELEFYRSHKIGAPQQHFISRVHELALSSNSGIYTDVNCAKCAAKIMTSVNPRYPKRNVYCRACYLNYLEQHG